jgi:hypothetical protein
MQNLQAGESGAWHAGLSRKRMIERFVMSWQLRVEDTYTMTSEMIGSYQASLAITVRQFKQYYQKAKKKGMFPSDWGAEDDKKLWEVANRDIHFALEKSDVVERFGYASGEHFVLRSIAEQVMGPLQSW